MDEDGEFNYNNLLNPNATGIAHGATGITGPTGIRGFASEKDASNAYDEKTLERCKTAPNPITFTLDKGEEFNADDTIYVRVSCNGSDVYNTRGVWTSSHNPRNATNADGTEVADIIWHQEALLLTPSGEAIMKTDSQCYMHVYGCEEPGCLGTPPAHNQQAFVQTLAMPIRRGKGQCTRVSPLRRHKSCRMWSDKVFYVFQVLGCQVHGQPHPDRSED